MQATGRTLQVPGQRRLSASPQAPPPPTTSTPPPTLQLARPAGCPIYEATRRGLGAALLRKPKKLAKLVGGDWRLRHHIPLPAIPSLAPTGAPACQACAACRTCRWRARPAPPVGQWHGHPAAAAADGQGAAGRERLEDQCRGGGGAAGAGGGRGCDHPWQVGAACQACWQRAVRTLLGTLLGAVATSTRRRAEPNAQAPSCSSVPSLPAGPWSSGTRSPRTGG